MLERISAAAALLACTAGVKAAALADLTLEQLSNIVVTTVSGREESLARAPASIYVISAEDIRRSGALSLPEALQLAPNLQIARPDSSQYAITARGFNSTLANKLLVLIDGRTVYSPLFSGTFWEAQDVLLEDVERIEVISGPGATLWGANAVNGVINIITRSAADTQGGLVTVGKGRTQQDGAMRYGGRAGDAAYRVYAKATRRDTTVLPAGTPVGDQADHAQAGFRADWSGFTLQGDMYGGELGPVIREIGGGNLLGRWRRELSGGAALTVQAYYDHTKRHHLGIFKEQLDTFDVEAQHRLQPLGRHRFIWGLGLRHYRDRVQNFGALAFTPPNRGLDRNQLFVQDEIALRDNLDFTLGGKVETNSYTGAEFLPSARLAWRPTRPQLVWTALSRAVRAPSRVDREFTQPGLAGGPNFESEISDVLEIGYRAQPSARLSFSATGFRHEHQRLLTQRVLPGGVFFTNDREGRTAGVEAWGSYRPADWVRLGGGFVRQHQAFRTAPGVVEIAQAQRDPRGWWKANAAFNLGASSDLDFHVRHYDALPANAVQDYTAVDMRFAWRARPNVELSLLIQNLLDPRHVEWSPGAQLERGGYLKLRIDL